MRCQSSQIRRKPAGTTAAAGLCLVGLGLGLAALLPSSSASVSGGTATADTAGVNNRRLQQAADVASSLFSHLKDPDLLDGDNPGWTNPPTAQPTPRPTASPTSNPIDTDPACQVSSESFSYFRPSAASSLETTPMALEVSFVYEVETTVEYGAEEMNDAVVAKVEEALGDALLPVLFDECAVGENGGADVDGSTTNGTEEMGGGGADGGDATSGTGDNTGSGSGGQSTTSPLLAADGSIVGITTSPPDLAVTGADTACTTTFIKPGNSCTVVEGVLTIYLPATTSTLAPFGDDGVANQQRIDAAVTAAQDAIRSAMEGGTLNDGAVDETVDTVTYARDGPYRDPIVALGTGEGGEDGSGGANGLPIYVAIAGGAVAVGAALLIVGAKMRSRQNEDKEDYDSDEDGDDGDDGEVDEDDENDVSGFHDNPTEVAERGGSRMYDMNPVVAPAPVDVPGADGPDASEPMVEGGGDWAAVGATAAVLASASDADAAADDAGGRV